MKEQMKNDLKKMIKQANDWDIPPCEHRCPFNRDETCIPCYDLFPGWGDMYLNENSIRSENQTERDYLEIWDIHCPCNTLGAEFVSWRIQLFLTKGI